LSNTSEPKEKILKRSAFRWTLNGQVCRWCYEHMEMSWVLETHDLILVEKIDDDYAFVYGEVK
jgi:hypothetical protein